MKFPRCGGWLLGAAVLACASAQTQIDLRTQSKSVDFSTVPTKPFRTGTALPATCSVGETFFKTNAPAGLNFYGCTAANTWTLQAVPLLPDFTGQAGKILSNNGSAAVWTGLTGGDISGAAGALLVQGLQGRTVSTANPTDGSALKWNASASRWEPGVPSITLAGDASGAAGSTSVKALQGRTVAATAPTDGQALKWNGVSSQWEPGVPGITLAGDAGGAVGSTVVRGLQGRAVATATPADGQALKWNGTSNQWEPGAPSATLAGDASGPASATVVQRLQGRTLSNAAPTDGQALKWNSTLTRWEPGMPSTTLAGDASGPATATVVKALQGLAVSTKSPTDGQALKWNGTSNLWEPGAPSTTLAGDASGSASATVVKGLQGRTVSSTAPASGQALEWNGTTNQWEPTLVSTSVSGDANGPLSATVVQRLQGRAVSATAPADGQALIWNGTLNQWQPTAGGGALAGDASGPASATVVKALQGRTVASTAPADGQTLQWNAGANQWQPSASSGGTLAGDASGPASATVVKALQGRTVASTAPSDGQTLEWNAGANQWQPAAGGGALAGDASGPASATVVKALQGRTLASTAPTDGQMLRWNGTASQWEPGGTVGNYSAAFTAQTSVVIAGSAHNFQTANLLVGCYDGSETLVEPDSISINGTTFDITIAFSMPQSGRCVVNGGGLGGSGSGGGGSGGAVDSVFGRTGAVAAQAGDYSFSQISGTISAGQLPASSHTAAGDVTGDLSATVVTAIQNRPVATTAATDGQVLAWNGTLARWEPRTVSGSGGGAPNMLTVTEGSSTTLSIGGSCSPGAPCNVRFGTAVQSIQAPATATLTSGSGTAYIYVDQNGLLTVGHNLTLTCSSGCQAVSGITGFPTNVIPIAAWTASSGSWASQGADWRAWLSTKVVNAGQGIAVVDAGGASTVAVDTALVPTYLTGSATLDFPSITNGACANDLTITVTGASPGNSVAPGWPGAMQRGLLGTMLVSGVDTVAVRLCNLSGMTIDPAPAVYAATIVRSF